jgi:hypothetical protein
MTPSTVINNSGGPNSGSVRSSFDCGTTGTVKYTRLNYWCALVITKLMEYSFESCNLVATVSAQTILHADTVEVEAGLVNYSKINGRILPHVVTDYECS